MCPGSAFRILADNGTNDLVDLTAANPSFCKISLELPHLNNYCSFFLFFFLVGCLFDQTGSYSLSLVVQCAACLLLVVTLGTEDIWNYLNGLVRYSRHAKI